MKFRCERDLLAEAFASAGRAVSSRATGSSAGVRVRVQGDVATFIGGDPDLTVAAQVEAFGEVDGTVLLPRMTADILKALEHGMVRVSTDDTTAMATIEAGRSTFGVRMIPDDGMGAQLPPVGAGGVTIGGPALADALTQVIRSTSRDEARPILTGVLMEAEPSGLRLVATDSYRLAVRDLPGTTVLQQGQSVIIPSRALAELNRVLDKGDVTLQLGEREATFVVGTTTIATRLIAGAYPTYRNLIPATLPNKLTVNRTALLEALRRIRLFAKDAVPVRLELAADAFRVVARNPDLGDASEDVMATYTGADATISFNTEFLIAGVETAGGDEITLECTDPQRPAVIRATDGADYLYLLMPVRTS